MCKDYQEADYIEFAISLHHVVLAAYSPVLTELRGRGFASLHDVLSGQGYKHR